MISMREIVLSQGKVALVDAEDYERISQFKWNFNGRYAKRTVLVDGKYITIMLHNFIMNTPEGMVVDHIDGNRLDNRKTNLRICTRLENSWNQKPRNNVSGYKGVSFYKPRNKWRARIGQDYIGLFDTKEEAAKAYNLKAKRLYGEFANLNEIE